MQEQIKRLIKNFHASSLDSHITPNCCSNCNILLAMRLWLILEIRNAFCCIQKKLYSSRYSKNTKLRHCSVLPLFLFELPNFYFFTACTWKVDRHTWLLRVWWRFNDVMPTIPIPFQTKGYIKTAVLRILRRAESNYNRRPLISPFIKNQHKTQSTDSSTAR